MSQHKMRAISLESDGTTGQVYAQDQSSSLFTPSPKARPKLTKAQRPSKKSLKDGADRVSQAAHIISGEHFLDTESSPMLTNSVETQLFKQHGFLADEEPERLSTQAITQSSQMSLQNDTQLSMAFPRFIHPMPTAPQVQYQQPKQFYQLPIASSSSDQESMLPLEPVIIVHNGAEFTIFECKLVCALRMFVRHGNTGECLDDETAAQVLKAVRESFGRRQHAQRWDLPLCHGLFDHVAGDHHKGGHFGEVWTDLSQYSNYWNRTATQSWWDWICYMDDLCRQYKLHNRLGELEMMIDDKEVLQGFSAVYGNDQHSGFPPQHMLMPMSAANQSNNVTEFQALRQTHHQTQQWGQEQVSQAHSSQRSGVQLPLMLPSIPMPSTPNSKHKRKRTARQVAPRTTPQLAPRMSETVE